MSATAEGDAAARPVLVATKSATPAAGSSFTGWSGDCSGTGACTLTMGAAHSATATFTARCVVPKVKGKKLRRAKRLIKKAHCSLGRVTKAYCAKVKKGESDLPEAEARRQAFRGRQGQAQGQQGETPMR